MKIMGPIFRSAEIRVKLQGERSEKKIRCRALARGMTAPYIRRKEDKVYHLIRPATTVATPGLAGNR